MPLVGSGREAGIAVTMALTCSTWNFKHLGGAYADPARVIRQIQALGFVPELWLNWDPRPDFYDRENWQGLRELVGPCPELSFHSRNDRERLSEEIELLAFLGGRVLVVHPVALSEPRFRQEVPARHPDFPFIRDLAALAREKGVFLALENIHARAFLDRTLEAVETFDDGGGLGICIDIGHAELRRDQPGESAVELIRDFGSVLLHLHVHDVRDGRDHIPLGSGSIDYRAVGEALREVGFAGTAALEIQADEPVRAAAAGREYLRTHLGDGLKR